MEYWRCLCTWHLGHMPCSFLFTSSVVSESFIPFHTDSQPVHDLCEVPSFQRAHSWENSPCSYQSVRLLRARFVPVSLWSLLTSNLQAGGSAVISPPCCSFWSHSFLQREWEQPPGQGALRWPNLQRGGKLSQPVGWWVTPKPHRSLGKTRPATVMSSKYLDKCYVSPSMLLEVPQRFRGLQC